VTTAGPGGSSQLVFTALRSVPYVLERNVALSAGPWAPVVQVGQRDQAWSPVIVSDPTTPALPDVFWRLSY